MIAHSPIDAVAQKIKTIEVSCICQGLQVALTRSLKRVPQMPALSQRRRPLSDAYPYIIPVFPIQLISVVPIPELQQRPRGQRS